MAAWLGEGMAVAEVDLVGRGTLKANALEGVDQKLIEVGEVKRQEAH